MDDENKKELIEHQKTVRTELSFRLSDEEIKKADSFIKKTREKYGEGTFTFSFTPTGIGVSTSIRSNLTKEELDITEYKKW